MTRTNIDLDDELVDRVIRKYGLKTKKEAVDFALRRAAGPKVTPEEILSLEGTGWDGDLDEIRNEPLRRLIHAEEAVMTAPIEMELLMGPTDELALRRVERVVAGLPDVAVTPDLDFRSAAHRAVRRTGRTVRSQVCLIAALALGHDVPLMHRDADFAAIAEVTGRRHRDVRGDA